MQKKEKTKIIEEILGKYLQEKNFEYKGYVKDIKGWAYEKKKGDITQTIMIYEHCSGLRLHLTTDAYMQGDLLDSSIIPKEKCCLNYMGFWGYKTKEDFQEIVDTFKAALEDKGLKELDKMSCHKTEVRPTAEREWYLYENHKELNRTMRAKLGILQDVTDIDIIGDILHKELLKRKNGGKEIIPDLIGLAAVYGEALVNYLNWKWIWDEKRKSCTVQIKYVYDCPLITIFKNWYLVYTGDDRNQTVEDLKYDYLKSPNFS